MLAETPVMCPLKAGVGVVQRSLPGVRAVLRRLVAVATIVGGAGLPFSQSASRGIGRRYIASGGQPGRQPGRGGERVASPGL